MKLILTFCFAFLVGWAIIASARDARKGIIILEGYEHAVVVCGESLTVNAGHFTDPEVALLIEKAAVECPKE